MAISAKDTPLRWGSSRNETCQVPRGKRLFFAIFYAGRSLGVGSPFENTAATWDRDIKLSEMFRPQMDVFLHIPVRTSADFRSACGGRGWSPAEIFACTQRVPTVGQKKSAHFSINFDRLTRAISPAKTLYLWSYDSDTVHDLVTTGSVFSGGSGSRVPGVVYEP
jgi:hypothetical protein